MRHLLPLDIPLLNNSQRLHLVHLAQFEVLANRDLLLLLHHKSLRV
jgi:hypothetical protein